MTAIIDTTLREGEQAPGVSFSLAEKKHIIDGLAGIGIDEVELGIASRLIEPPASLLRYCRRVHPRLSCSLWSRCMEKDIRFAAFLRPDILSLSLPVSEILLRDKLEKTRTWAGDCLSACLNIAEKLGMAVSVGFEDAFRADPEFLVHMARVAERHGALRIRLADTLGTSTPAEVGERIGFLATILNRTSLAIHCHNDFGMATANAIAALEHGADYADAALFGLGERCGCTRLEELAGFLTLKRQGQYDLRRLPPLSRYVAKIAGRDISPDRPFIGEDIFTCESGLHLSALYKNPQTYEPYPPETVGAERRLLLGPKAGRQAILAHLEALGYRPDRCLGEAAVKAVRQSLARQEINSDDLAAWLCR
ncbi:MAG: LeuA family protein [Desulfopila sp.]